LVFLRHNKWFACKAALASKLNWAVLVRLSIARVKRDKLALMGHVAYCVSQCVVYRQGIALYLWEVMFFAVLLQSINLRLLVIVNKK
jgi:hypothetical protein